MGVIQEEYKLIDLDNAVEAELDEQFGSDLLTESVNISIDKLNSDLKTIFPKIGDTWAWEDEDGNPVYRPLLDEDGNPIYENGEPVYEVDEDGNKIQLIEEITLEETDYTKFLWNPWITQLILAWSLVHLSNTEYDMGDSTQFERRYYKNLSQFQSSEIIPDWLKRPETKEGITQDPMDNHAFRKYQ